MNQRACNRTKPPTTGRYTVHSQVGLGRGRVGGLVGVPADGLLLGAGGLQLLFEVQRLVAVDALVAELVIAPPKRHWGARSLEHLKENYVRCFPPLSADFTTPSTEIRTYSERIHFSPEYAT